MKLHRVSDEVFVAAEPIVRLGSEDIAFLKQQAISNPRKRARICAHADNDDALHEMIIAIASASYIRPHRHIGKSESFHIVHGSADIVMFDDAGSITDVIELGEPESGRSFFYRLSDSRFHMPLSCSDMLVIHEVTNGPFDRDRTIMAPFAPPEEDFDRAAKYMSEISTAAAQRAVLQRHAPKSR